MNFKGFRILAESDDKFDTNGAWLDKKARFIADKLAKTFGNELSTYPKALWMALDVYDDNLAYAFCNEHGIDASSLKPASSTKTILSLTSNP